MTNYELWYADDLGNRIAYINDVISFEYAKVIGGIGVGMFQLPVHANLYKANIPDRRIHIYRQPAGGRLRLDFTCRLRKFDTNTTQDGQFWRDLTGMDNNEILNRRIVAYRAGDDQSKLDNEFVDDGMKRIWLEAQDGADGRDTGDHGFTIAPDQSLGPQIDKGFSWRNVLELFQALQADSKAEGNEVFFGLVGVSETATRFDTWVDQPGRDLSGKVIFSLESGNLYNPRLSYDYSEEANYIYSGGQGQELDRIVEEVSDTDRINVSRLNWIEKFRHSQAETAALAIADGMEELELSRPRVNFMASIADTPSTRYGRDWNIGDKVTISYSGLQIDTIIRTVRVRVDQGGKETIESKVENVG